MRILIANDDGHASNGMQHLEPELALLGEVWSVCPDRERSASSMGISIRESLTLTQVGPRSFTVSGLPVDCVNVALFTDYFPAFDLVVSGINHGVNMGDDVGYSGTVGAARHAALHGVPAIAASCGVREADGDFRRAARWVRTWLEEHRTDLRPEIAYSINYPLEPKGTTLGSPALEARYVRQGRRAYKDAYRELERGDGYYIIHIEESDLGRHVDPGTDFEAYEAGFVAVTPIGRSTTDLAELERITAWQTANNHAKN